MHRNFYPHQILLVDDSEADQKLAGQALLLSDLAGLARLEYAPDGAAALRAIEAHTDRPYDAILLDLDLPVVSGQDVLRHIRPLCTDTPILIMTHSDSSKDIEECIKLGADAYFVKPIDFDQMIFFFAALAKSFGSNRRLEVPSMLKMYEEYAAA